MNQLPLAFALLLSLTFAKHGVAEETPVDPSLLTLDRLYGGDEFDGHTVDARWLDEATYTVLESAEEGGKEIAAYDAASGERRVLVSAASLTPSGSPTPLPVDDYAWSDDRSRVLIYTNSQRVWRQKSRGDYWVFDRTSRQLIRIGGDAAPATLQFAKFSPNGRRVAFVRQGNIYVQTVGEDDVRALTHSRNPFVVHGTFDWVYEEEFGLRDGFRWSKDGKRIAYWTIDSLAVEKFPLVNHTDSLYPQVKWIPYPKVGQTNPIASIHIVEVAGGGTRQVELPSDWEEFYVPAMEWLGDGRLVVHQLNRPQNQLRVLIADAARENSAELFVDADDAWLDMHDDLIWFADDQRFAFASERDGWRRIYLGARGDGSLRLATPGEFDVIDLLHVDEAAEQLWFLAAPDDPTQRFLYRCDFDGDDLQRVTPAEAQGVHAYRLSPECGWAIHTASSMDSPPVVELIGLPQHQTVRTLSDNAKLKEKLAALRISKPEFFRIAIEDDVELDGWLIAPPEYDEAKKYSLLVYVYGEPAGATVVDGWSPRNYLWHQMLAQQGYFVMSIDNRGTKAPRGRAWRKSVHQKIGVLPPQDQAAAVRAVLKERPYLDPDRVASWGWSGGGSMSLNAIFKYPDLYSAAIAVAPVPNQRYYDTIYQERYMGLPKDNPEGFLAGSPINFAHQLEGDLLLVHGTGDDNCHWATTPNASRRTHPLRQAVRADGLSQPQPFDQRTSQHDPPPASVDDGVSVRTCAAWPAGAVATVQRKNRCCDC